MGALRTEHELNWKMRLTERGYTCWELVDELGRRWGWTINANRVNWTAHIGNFGDYRLPVDLEESAQTFDTIAEGREWIEQGIAAAWQAAASSGRAEPRP